MTSVERNQILVSAIQKLSLARDQQSIIETVRHAARELTGADGATVILKDGTQCYYVDEDAIAPLWKGKRFPLEACISGWAMIHRRHAVIPDIYQDPRIPQDAYRPTFVKSLVMVPIRSDAPIGAIGNYWSDIHQATDEEIQLLQSLADSTSIAFESVQFYTELQASLQESKKAREELKRQLDLRDEFISAASHELKTPLTPLLLQLQLLERLQKKSDFEAFSGKSDIRRYIEVSKRQLWNFTRLIDNCLEVSRIQMGRQTVLCRDGVNLSALVRRSAKSYQSMSSTEFVLDMDTDVCGYWDDTKLEQVISNLFSNAILYGNSRPVLISLKQEGERAVLKIRDHGGGIESQNMARIFDRFERTPSIKNFGGLGLGLYICRRILDKFGGKIQAESQPGQGSTFTVELPLRNIEAPSESVQESEEQISAK